MGSEDSAEILSIEGREVRVTHPGKLYFSTQTKVSKLDLVRYYLSVAPVGIRDRPIVLKRFVNGADEEAFYQKRAPAERTSWLRTATRSLLLKRAEPTNGKPRAEGVRQTFIGRNEWDVRGDGERNIGAVVHCSIESRGNGERVLQ